VQPSNAVVLMQGVRQEKPLVAVLSLFSHSFYVPSITKTGGAERRAHYWLQILHAEGYKVAGIIAHQNNIGADFKSDLNADWPLYEHPKYGVSGQIVRAPKPENSFWSKLRDKALKVLQKPLPNSTAKNAWLSQAVYKHIDADVYIAFGLNNVANDLARFCSENNKKLILCAIHDLDFDFLSIQSGKDMFDNKRWLKHETLKAAEVVVVQNAAQVGFSHQAGIPKEKVVRISNPIDVLPLPPKEAGNSALWVGRFDANKNAHALLALAKRLPEIRFKMVVSARPTPEEMQEISRHPNVELLDGVRPEHMRNLYLHSFCLVSTAFLEGFPNTFLEAWEAEIPVASLHVNPNELLTEQGLGHLACGDIEALSKVIRYWSKNPTLSQSIGRKARQYVTEEHETAKVAEQILRVLSKI
jgi:glycosyltransferase involved in cell wall biosynthesis